MTGEEDMYLVTLVLTITSFTSLCAHSRDGFNGRVVNAAAVASRRAMLRALSGTSLIKSIDKIAFRTWSLLKQGRSCQLESCRVFASVASARIHDWVESDLSASRCRRSAVLS